MIKNLDWEFMLAVITIACFAGGIFIFFGYQWGKANQSTQTEILVYEGILTNIQILEDDMIELQFDTRHIFAGYFIDGNGKPKLMRFENDFNIGSNYKVYLDISDFPYKPYVKRYVLEQTLNEVNK